MSQEISAAAISRILNTAGVKKANRGSGWSSGYECFGLTVFVQVHYTARSHEDLATELKRIAAIINDRKDRKYVAVVNETIVEVRIREEAPETPEAEAEARIEKMAEESPYAVTIAEVTEVIRQGRYAYDAQGAGYVVTREPSPDDRLVRVTYRDHPHTSYALVTGGREAYAQEAVNSYGRSLTEAGYSVLVDHREDDGWSLLVGTAGEFTSQEQAAEQAEEPLLELRKAIEDHALSYMTRQAGPTSIFVYYLIPFKDKLRRLEVFWANGVYSSRGIFGGAAKEEFRSLPHLVEYIHSEIGQ